MRPLGFVRRITILSRLDNLHRVSDFIEDSLGDFGWERGKIIEVQVAVSEACTNVIHHGYSRDANGIIDISCFPSDNKCIIKLRDYGKPFNPLQVEPPDVKSDLWSRTIGGLGIHLIKNLLDEVRYEYNAEHGCETLTMVKYP